MTYDDDTRTTSNHALQADDHFGRFGVDPTRWTVSLRRGLH
jgi:hypothetical protein